MFLQGFADGSAVELGGDGGVPVSDDELDAELQLDEEEQRLMAEYQQALGGFGTDDEELGGNQEVVEAQADLMDDLAELQVGGCLCVCEGRCEARFVLL
jgi:hypothetical protein